MLRSTKELDEIEEIFNRLCIDSRCDDENQHSLESVTTDNSIYKQIEEKQRQEDADKAYEQLLKSAWHFEEFVMKILESTTPAFVETEDTQDHLLDITPKRKILKEEALSTYFPTVHKITYNLEFGYRYSPNIKLLVDCWNILRLHDMGFTKPNAPSHLQGKRQFEVFNELIDLIRKKSKEVEHTTTVRRLKEQYRRRMRSTKRYLTALFENKSTRLLVLRLDLAYAKDCAKQVTLAEAKRDLEHLLNNRRANRKVFDGWLGYIRKIEWSPQKGIHFHMVIFMSGQHRFQDNFIARQIGEYWVDLTHGKGIYWNCNNSKHEYQRCGIGMMKIDDSEKRQILLNDVVSYLAKTEQFLRPDILKNESEKLFVTGTMHKPRTTKVGRKRKSQVCM